MGIGKSSPPPAPDYAGAAKAQGQANIDSSIAQALLNRPDINTPFGKRVMRQTGTQTIGAVAPQPFTGQGGLKGFMQAARSGSIGGSPGTEVPTYEMDYEYSPMGQAIVDNASNILSKPMDISGVSDLTNKAEAAYMDRLNPQLDRDRESRISNLSVRGFKPGSTTYNTEVDALGRQENDARSQAILKALGYAPSLLQQEIGIRNQPINEISAILNGTQLNVPQVGPVGAAPIAGAANAAGQYGTDVWNAEQQQRAGVMNAGALLGAAYMMSDRRLKKNIKQIGTLESGLPWYSFEYLWGEKAEGVMADEAEKVFPDAVWEVHGFKMVDYGQVR